jgi:hypothetical protein
MSGRGIKMVDKDSEGDFSALETTMMSQSQISSMVEQFSFSYDLID